MVSYPHGAHASPLWVPQIDFHLCLPLSLHCSTLWASATWVHSIAYTQAFRMPGMSNRFHNSFLELHFLDGASTILHFYGPMIALLLLFLFSPSESSFFSLSNVMSTSPYHSPHPNQNLHEKLMDVLWGGICRRGTLFPNYFHAMNWIRK